MAAGLPNAVPEMKALEAAIAIAAGMDVDDGAERFRIGPERSQLGVTELHRSRHGRDGDPLSRRSPMHRSSSVTASDGT